MARYYPKSQLRTNLFTNGNEFKTSKKENSNLEYNKSNPQSLKSNNTYIGPYHQTSEGLSFTGKTPNDSSILLYPISQNISPSENLSPISPIIIKNNNPNFSSYFQVNERYIPTPTKSKPTEQNYLNNIFPRYFCKKTNEILYFEIDKKTYTDLVNKSLKVAYDLYIPILVRWNLLKIKNLMYLENKNLIFQISQDKNLPGFFQYFKNNFAEYYLET
jgi:hypothetical protein